MGLGVQQPHQRLPGFLLEVVYFGGESLYLLVIGKYPNYHE